MALTYAKLKAEFCCSLSSHIALSFEDKFIFVVCFVQNTLLCVLSFQNFSNVKLILR